MRKTIVGIFLMKKSNSIVFINTVENAQLLSKIFLI